MARSPQPTPGARESDAGTDLPPTTPVDGAPPAVVPEAVLDSSAATPTQAQINPEPFNPNFDDRNAENTELGTGVPGMGGGGEERRIEVETTGQFMIQDPYTLDLVPASGSGNVRHTSFIDTAIADGRLRKVGE